MRSFPLLALILAACSAPAGAPASPSSTHDSAPLREQLLAADRAFSAAAADRGLEGWMSVMADDAVRLEFFGPLHQGRAAVRAADAPLFADPAARLVWQPVEAATWSGGRLGLTRGAWEFIAGDASLARGEYLTLWRRTASGNWEVILDTGAPQPAPELRTRWSADRAWAWHEAQPWLTGCNFLPSTASNQLETWQAATFDEATLERELGWAARLGFNTVRTYLHDLAWQADPEGFLKRVDRFLDIAQRHGIRPMLVLFDDCWNDDPQAGPQADPIPGVHNSRWARSPGSRATLNPQEWLRLEDYVRAVVGRFARDPRVLMWDLYNEPGNSGMGLQSLPLLRATFAWARACGPSQPLTAGLWAAGTDFERLNAEQIALSDVVTFHNYNGPDSLREQIAALRAHGRPLICTEWLRRGHSEVDACLPVFAAERVGCLNWGLVRGRSNTVYPWGSPTDAPIPPRWFHDLLEPDGRPHDATEVRTFQDFAARMRNAE